ncbi:MAG: hypothetical protein K2Q26_12205 [Bdellovibrionales bacterium]|nr:hypothetical protein [Bdellovibrionales bacterium]
MTKNNKTDWEKDFSEFLLTEPVEVPERLTNSILEKIHRELNPSAWKVFSKVSLIHFAVGFVTLLFCPQFGISITSQLGVMPYLMQFGHEVCMLGCGAIFVGFSLFTASFSLKAEEIRVLKNNAFLQMLLLTTLSIGFFIAIGGEIVITLGLIWMAGAIIGGIFSLDLGWTLRRYLASKAIA